MGDKNAATNREIERRFIKVKVADTRCPEAIRALGVEARHVYLLRDRIDCSHWQHVSKHFLGPVVGKHIVTQPPAARKVFTLRPERAVAAMKKRGLW